MIYLNNFYILDVSVCMSSQIMPDRRGFDSFSTAVKLVSINTF